MAAKLSTDSEMTHHRVVTDQVHAQGGRIAMQILHSGRYGYHPFTVSASAKKSPIGLATPRALSAADIEATIDDFVRCSELALRAGYDGVEIMGSEGYFINQFLAPRTNHRTDEWGGSFGNRSRLAREIVTRVRKATADSKFAVIFRLSLLELIDDGMSFDESADLAAQLVDAGVDVINSGIGWHEARVPTIATSVPRAAFTFPTRKLAAVLGVDKSVALCATNRINSAATAERVLREDGADLVSMARPFLADADLVAKSFGGRDAEVNTCIACNQACLDHTFKMVPVSCLVNPRAGHETSLNLMPTARPLKVAVVGAGPAGLACAVSCATRGHEVTLFEAAPRIGGQFNYAARIPGKAEFHETLRYFETQLELLGVDVRLGTKVEAAADHLEPFDRVVVATGVLPRPLKLKGADIPGAPRVHSYVEVITGSTDLVGDAVAIVGAGGIGFDVAELLSHVDETHVDETTAFYDEWGIDTAIAARGGLRAPVRVPRKREIHLLQRKPTSLGAGLGKTTGWIHRTTLRQRGVNFVAGCEYVGLSPGAFEITVKGTPRTLDVTDIVICAGQQSVAGLFDQLQTKGGPTPFVIGGAQHAGELDAKRAIDQGYRLATQIDDAPAGAVFEMPTGWKHKAVDLLFKALGKKL